MLVSFMYGCACLSVSLVHVKCCIFVAKPFLLMPSPLWCQITGLLAQVDKNKKVKEIEDFIKKVGLGPRKVSWKHFVSSSFVPLRLAFGASINLYIQQMMITLLRIGGLLSYSWLGKCCFFGFLPWKRVLGECTNVIDKYFIVHIRYFSWFHFYII